MSNILIQETIDKFGYDPSTLRRCSGKLVVYKCPICEEISDKKYRLHDRICYICSNRKKAKEGAKKRSASMKHYWEEHQHPLLNKKRSIDTKQKISTTVKQQYAEGKRVSPGTGIHRFGIDNPFFGKKHDPLSFKRGKDHHRYGKKPNYGKRIKYKDFIFRSTWEYKTAIYLDENNIAWQYEPGIIEIEYRDNKGKLIQTTYLPDFLITSNNTYIEVKGRWYPGYKEKFEAACLNNDIELWGSEVLKRKGII